MRPSLKDDAAYAEAVNVAGLDAEQVYDQMMEDRESGIAFLRSLLRLQKATQLTCNNFAAINKRPS